MNNIKDNKLRIEAAELGGVELPGNPDSMPDEITSIEYAVHLTAATGRLVSLEQADRFLRINKLVQWSVEGALQRPDVSTIVRSTGGWLVFGENARDPISPTEARKWLICPFFFTHLRARSRSTA